MPSIPAVTSQYFRAFGESQDGRNLTGCQRGATQPCGVVDRGRCRGHWDGLSGRKRGNQKWRLGRSISGAGRILHGIPDFVNLSPNLFRDKYSESLPETITLMAD